MMNFRIINQAIIQTLGNAAAGRFQTIGYETQGVAASEIKGNLRTVQSYYSKGDFPKGAGRQRGSKKHTIDYTLGFYVSSAAKVDLGIINREGATQGQIANALAAFQDGAYAADLLFDELVDIVWNILNDGRNYDLGLPVGTISDTWVDSVRKDPPVPKGSLVTLTGEMHLSLSTQEEVTGDTGIPMTGGVDVKIQMPGDDVQQTDITVIVEGES